MMIVRNNGIAGGWGNIVHITQGPLLFQAKMLGLLSLFLPSALKIQLGSVQLFLSFLSLVFLYPSNHPFLSDFYVS